MIKKTWRITGQVTDGSAGLDGYGVEVWELDAFKATMRGQPTRQTEDQYRTDLSNYTVTANGGNFYFDLGEEAFLDLEDREVPQVFFRVYDSSNTLVLDTVEIPSRLDVPERTHVTLTVTPGAPVTDKTFSVSGTIRFSDLKPAERYPVKAYDQSFRAENLLGETTASTDGTYRIPYDNSSFSGVKELADLTVKVCDIRDPNTVLTTSKLILNAPKHARVDLFIEAPEVSDPTEYAFVDAKLSGEISGTPPGDIDERDIDYLANKHSLTRRQVEYYVKAQVLDDPRVVPAEFFYGLFRQNQPREKYSLATQPKDTLKQAALDSIAENVISDPGALLDTYLDSIRTTAGDDLIDSGSDRVTYIQSIMDVAEITTPEDRKKVVGTLLGHEQPTDQYWEDLVTEGVDPGLVDNLKLTTQLSSLSRSHQPMVAEIYGAADITTFEDTAKWERSRWETAVTAAGGPPDEYEGDSARYVDDLIRTTEENIPYPSFRARMDDGTGHDFGEYRDFLETHVELPTPREFDLGETNLPEFLADNGIDISDTQMEKDVFGLQGVYRIAKAAGRFNTAEKMWDAGVQSPFTIALGGRTAFNEALEGSGISSDDQDALYNTAVNGVSEAIFVGTANLANFVPTKVLPDTIEGETSPSPDYEHLFGLVNNCEVEHCASVLGPSAYLVDTLEYLRRSIVEGADPPETGYDWLQQRRADITGAPGSVGVRLSCENAMTPMPYIDLTNEIFERALAFAEPAIPDPSGNSPQTTWPEEELKAHPEHVNDDVYDGFLRTKIYPWNFDLRREEAAAYSAMVDCPRYEIMEAFRADPSDVPDPDIACERLGITPPERVALGSGSIETWRFYSAVDFDPAELQTVSVLLKRGRMTYEELLELIEVAYINVSEVEIVYDAEQPCSLDLATLAFTEEGFRRLYRFRLMMLKTGWSATELDELFSVLGFSAVNFPPGFFRVIAKAKQLEEELEVSIGELTKWWTYTVPRESFLKKFRMDEEELDTWRAVLEPEPLKPETGPPNPLNTERFIEQRDTLRDAGFTADQVAYLTGVKTDDAFADFPGDEEIVSLLKEYQDSVVRELEDYPTVLADVDINHDGDDLGEITDADLLIAKTLVLRLRLETWIPLAVSNEIELPIGDIVDEVMAIIDASSSQSPDDQRIYIETHCGHFLDAAKVWDGLIEDTEKTPAERLDFAMGLMVENAVCDTTSNKFGMTTRAARILLNNTDFWSITIESVVYPAVEYLAHKLVVDDEAGNLVPKTPDEIYSDFQPLFTRLFKVGVIASAVEMNQEFVDYFQVELVADPNTVDALLAMVKADNLNTAISGPQGSLFDVLASATPTVLLADLTGWLETDITDLANHFVEEWTDYLLVERIRVAHEYIGKLRAPASAILNFRSYPVPPPMANAIKNAVRNLFDDDDWYEKAPDIRGPIRQGQRNILQAYLLARDETDEFASVYDLYEYYLIDSEVEPCFMTSRLKLAMSSTQLFVQRVLMGLEADDTKTVVFPREAKEEWKWRKNYRVWEANRKVFLYPENWIEPELRDDKTPFFVELEEELLQNEVTEENVEKALLSYLRKLDEVSHLEICGMCKEYDSKRSTTEKTYTWDKYLNYTYVEDYKLHIIGRTRGQPQRYYYRSWEAGLWSPWENIDLEITTDQILPVVYNRRLFLFWPEITPKPRKNSDYIDRYELKMAWSSYADGTWTPRKLSTARKLLDATESELRKYLYKVFIDSATNELTILVFKAFDVAPSDDSWVSEAGQAIPSRVLINMDQVENGLAEYRQYMLAANLFGGFVMGGCSDDMETWAQDYDEIKALPNFVVRPEYTVVEGNKFRELFVPAELVSVLPGHKPQPEGVSKQDMAQDISGFEFGEGGEIDWEDRWDLLSDDFQGLSDNVLPRGTKFRSVLHRRDQRDFSKSVETLVDRNRFALIEKAGNGNYIDSDEYLMSFLSPHNYAFGVVLRNTPRIFRVLPTLQDPFFLAESPFTYEDGKRSFFVIPQDSTTVLPNIGNRMAELERLERLETNFATGVGDKTRLIEDLNGAKISRRFRDGSVFDVHGSEVALPPHQKFAGRQKSSLSTYTNDMSTRVGAALDSNSFGLMTGTFKGMTLVPTFWQRKRYLFQPLYHAHSCLFIKQVNRYGVTGLLDPGHGAPEDVWDKYLVRQGATYETASEIEDYFVADYDPNPYTVDEDHPKDDIDFSLTGPYGMYNWEVFFHIPLYIATQLSRNQRFEEAHRWFQFIFDDTQKEADEEDEATYWKTKPFYLHVANMGNDVTKYIDEQDNLPLLIKLWRKNPFSPHLIARFRKAAYMKNVVMKYLDNLIGWGDMLFRRDTIESINEATQYYLLAAQVLGEQPVFIKHDEDAAAKPDYEQLRQDFAGLLTTYVPKNDIVSDEINVLTSLVLFGGAPKNEILLEYWKTVADRLYKIRNCMNIEGVVRALELFAPPIDPALLVRAAAAGIDFGAVLNDLAAPTPVYRYRVLQQKAVEFVNDVKTLGGNLLAALEKKDATKLELLRASQEVDITESMTQLKELAIDEAKETLESLNRTLETTQTRLDHYEDLIDDGLLAKEKQNEKQLAIAQGLQIDAGIYDVMSSVMFAIPDSSAGVAAAVTFGGSNLGNIMRGVSAGFTTASSMAGYMANKASIEAGYERREEDWELQRDLADDEIKQIEKQIVAAEIRVAIGEADLESHKLRVNQTKEVEAYLKNRYTSDKLYAWMIGQISGVYFQAYQMAYEMARKAEKAYKSEIFGDDTYYINFGNWDSLHKGLLAGEKLHNDIKRLDAAYLKNNKRMQEVTKPISLAMLNPEQLLELRASGSCEFTVPELAFDMDYPGQYQRRIKAVSVTIPCVAGPNTNVSGKLTLLKDKIRLKPESGEADDVVLYNYAPIQAIATSNAQDDSGMFVLDFNDERYLPFEGGGAVESKWRLELPTAVRQFDYSTISDLVLSIRYTAKEDGLFRTQVETALDLGTLSSAVEFKGLFEAALMEMRAGNQGIAEITKEMLPYLAQHRDVTLSGDDSVIIGLKLKNPSTETTLNIDYVVGTEAPAPLVLSNMLDGEPSFWFSGSFNNSDVLDEANPLVLKLTPTTPTGYEDEIDNVVVILSYTTA